MTDPITRLNAALEGRYRIEREIGQGGMAIVYLAEDLKHHRQVALKVLKPELAAVVGAERFLAEIETTAKLNHPHILPLHDSGEADGFLFFVMPYVAGDTLRDKIDREKQLSIEEAVKIAEKVASALDYAHEHGVVHRDIKPGNILLSERGEPTVADFGIALAVAEAGGGRVTETGLSVGTPHYMSPEQATGDRDVDPRTDVYALGCVLYEMLIGEPPHSGSTAQAVLGKIIQGNPISVTEARGTVPPHVDSTIRKALEKLPADRFTTALALAEALEDPGFRHAELSAGATAAGPWNRLSITMTVAAAALGFLALYSFGSGLSQPDEPGPPVVWAQLPLPVGVNLGGNPDIALSADGSTLVVPVSESGSEVLLQRRLATGSEFQAIGQEAYPRTRVMLSPSGQDLAFAGSTGMVRTPLAGGPVVDLGPAPIFGGDWAADSMIYFAPRYDDGLWVVGSSAEGGSPTQLSSPDREAGELGHWHPQLLPDGDHLLFTAMRSPADSARIRSLSLSTGEIRTVQQNAFFGRYSRSGHLVFARGPDLWAAPFDLDLMQTTAAAVPVIEAVAASFGNGISGFALSDNGTLVYVPEDEFSVLRRVVSIDRTTATEVEIEVPVGFYGGPSLSPDGVSLAVGLQESGRSDDVIVFGLTGGRSVPVPLAQGPGAQFSPHWTPSGERLIYICEGGGFYQVCARSANSAEPPTVLFSSDFDKNPYSFSSDGSRLIMLEDSSPRRFLSLSLDNPSAPPDTLTIGATGFIEAPALSPDGRWIAYVSEETGAREVWVESLDPAVSRRWLASEGGGFTPHWTKDGAELVYRGVGQASVFAVSIDEETGEPGVPTSLFDDRYYYGNQRFSNWDVTPDGERFIMLAELEDGRARSLSVVTNFFEVLRQVAPN